MASYFEAINNNNSTLIDDQYSNYALWMKGTAVTNTPGGPTFGVQITLPKTQTDTYPIIALVHNGFVNLMSNQRLTTGEWLVRFLLSDTDTGAGLPLEWYAFLPSDAPEIALKQTGMFCLWDESGKPLFDSDADYMRIVDFPAVQYQSPITKSYPAGRKYAVVVALAQVYVRPAQSPGGWGSLSGVSARVRSDGSARYEYVRLRSASDGPPNPSSSPNINKSDTGVFIIIDVTGM